MMRRLPPTDEDLEIITHGIMRRMAAWPAGRAKGHAWVAVATRAASDYIEDGRRRAFMLDVEDGRSGCRATVAMLDEFSLFNRMSIQGDPLSLPVLFEVNPRMERLELPNFHFLKEYKPRLTQRQRREQLRGSKPPKQWNRK